MRWLLALLLLTGSALADSINIPAPLYVTGTWTPTIIGSSVAGTGQTYSGQIGTYEQIGRQVTLRFNLIVTSLGTASGSMQIGGLPIANVSGDLGHCYISGYSVTGLTALNYGIMGQISSGTSVIVLLSNSNTTNANISNVQTGGTPFFQGMCTYRAS